MGLLWSERLPPGDGCFAKHMLLASSASEMGKMDRPPSGLSTVTD